MHPTATARPRSDTATDDASGPGAGRGDGWLSSRIGRQNAGRVLLILAWLGLVAMLVVLHVWLFF